MKFIILLLFPVVSFSQIKFSTDTTKSAIQVLRMHPTDFHKPGTDKEYQLINNGKIVARRKDTDEDWKIIDTVGVLQVLLKLTEIRVN